MQSRSLAALTTFAFMLALVVGHVTDATTAQPLPNVHVIFLGKKPHGAVTNVNGGYRLAGIPPGSYTVKIYSKDVPVEYRHVTVGPGTTTVDAAVCSTALDYQCGNPAGSGPGSGA